MPVSIRLYKYYTAKRRWLQNFCFPTQPFSAGRNIKLPQTWVIKPTNWLCVHSSSLGFPPIDAFKTEFFRDSVQLDVKRKFSFIDLLNFARQPLVRPF